MTLQQLQYFLAAFEHGSFSAAAESLHLAQPSLSEQVRRLEAELGVALFQRVGRGLVPTEAGPRAAPARRGGARRRRGRARVGRRGARAARPARRRSAPSAPRATYLGHRPRRGLPPPPSRACACGSSARTPSETVDGGPRRGARGRASSRCRSTTAAWRCSPAMRDEVALRLRRPGAPARTPMTIERLAERAADPLRGELGHARTRRAASSRELAQRAGVAIEPQIDVEDVEVGARARRAAGWATRSRRAGCCCGSAPRPSALGWVPFAEPIYETFAFISRRGAQLSPATREFMRRSPSGAPAALAPRAEAGRAAAARPGVE